MFIMISAVFVQEKIKMNSDKIKQAWNPNWIALSHSMNAVI